MEIGKLNNVEVWISNEEDYTIKARLSINGKTINGISRGTVKKGDNKVADFNVYSTSVNYTIQKEDETLSIMQAITNFREMCKTMTEAGFSVEVGGEQDSATDEEDMV